MGEQNRVPKLPLEGKIVVEVGRFPYFGSERHNGGEWVYELRLVPYGPSLEIRLQEIELQITRQRFDAVQQRRKGIAEVVRVESVGVHVPAIKSEVEAFGESYRRQLEVARSICERAERQYFARLETLRV